MFHLGEIAVLVFASLWLVKGQPGTVRTAEYDVLRNYSGQHFPLCIFRQPDDRREVYISPLTFCHPASNLPVCQSALRRKYITMARKN